MKNGKRATIVLILVLAVTVTVGAGSAAGADLIKVNLNGKGVSPDTPPTLQNGRIMVPLRFISELFGVDVFWDSKNQTVNLNYREPFANDGPLGSLMLVEKVTINNDGTWELFAPGVVGYYTGYNNIIAVYTADNLTEGPHAFQIAVRSLEGGAVVKSLLNTYEVGPDGYFLMYEEVPTYFPNPGQYVVDLSIDGKVVSKTVIFAENPPAT